MKALWLAAAAGIAMSLSASVDAALSPGEQDLAAFLDKEYAPGLLKIGSRGRDPDGNYRWSATFHRELRRPLEKVTAFCARSGGAIQLLITAGNIRTHPGSATISPGGQTFRIDQGDLWEWSRHSRSHGNGVFVGFDKIFDSRHVAGRTRTVEESNANPPLGLFGCFSASRTLHWAVSIMPGEYGGNNWLYMMILPVTADFLAEKRAVIDQAARQEAAWQQSQAEQQRIREEHARRENIRLAPWRKALTLGSSTNCGMVIAVRGPLVEVQLPGGLTGPDGIRQFWAKRDDLTDASVGEGCRFGR